MNILKELAFKVATKSANEACPWVLYTPKMPKSVKKLKKSK